MEGKITVQPSLTIRFSSPISNLTAEWEIFFVRGIGWDFSLIRNWRQKFVLKQSYFLQYGKTCITFAIGSEITHWVYTVTGHLPFFKELLNLDSRYSYHFLVKLLIVFNSPLRYVPLLYIQIKIGVLPNLKRRAKIATANLME